MTSEWPIRSDYQCVWDKSIRRTSPQRKPYSDSHQMWPWHPPHLKIRPQQLFSIFNWQKDKKAPQFLEKYCLRAIDYNFGPLRHFSIILKLKLPFEALNHWHSNWDWHFIGNLVWDILLRPSITDIQLKHHNRSGEGTRNFCNIFNNGYIQVILPLPIQSEKKQNSIEFLKNFFKETLLVNVSQP